MTDTSEVKVRPVTDLVAQGRQRRRDIVRFVEMYQRMYGFSPSMEEIAKGVGVAKNAVRHHLLKLQELGVVDMSPGKYRSLRIVGELDEENASRV